jgi:hypothetical protein
MAKCSECGEKKNPTEAKFCSKCGTALGAGGSVSKPQVETTYANKCAILGELWLNYRTDEDYEDFIEYNDIGLPLAYILDSDIAESTSYSENYINETFALLLERFEIEDQGFEDLDELLSAAE